MLNGRKLVLRPIELKDLEILRQIKNDPEISALAAETINEVSQQMQQEWFEASKLDRNTVRFACVKSNDDCCIGLTGLWELNTAQGHSNVGLKFHSSLPRGEGYGTDAINVLTAYAFSRLGLHRLETKILESNKASLTLFIEKCGWQIEGIQREKYFLAGKYHNLVLVSILEQEYMKLPSTREYLELLSGKIEKQ